MVVIVASRLLFSPLFSSLRTLSYPLIVVPITKYGVVFDHASFSLSEYEPLPPRHLEVSCATELLLEGVAPEGIVLADRLEASAHKAQTDCRARRQKREHMLEDLRWQFEDVRDGLGRTPRLTRRRRFKYILLQICLSLKSC